MASRTSLLLAVLGVTALSAGCATRPEPPDPVPTASAADRHRITVALMGERLDVQAAPHDRGLDAETRAQVRAFGADYAQRGRGSLVLSAPSGGANADAAAVAAQEARMALVEGGVSYAAIAASTYDATGLETAPVVLSFSRYEAFAPECAPLWEQDLTANMERPHDSFGCSFNANLAAMIEDPEDLIRPRESTPRDSERRAVVIERYREGSPTGATRGPDERVTISTAVQ
jgi:pilus assembly protein CpaD